MPVVGNENTDDTHAFHAETADDDGEDFSFGI
ncbi:hypothetical protein T03_3728 [Trichinella britovi]|uniref:Uncharacterized protein n=1 Tax=Trichinella britovi TaxID=45882 RepID=A0A0V1C134_TRIBR|nr:hypothetical protein T03_3728 [Trichinella britovi]